MSAKTRIWLHRLVAAFIGGGASAIVSGLTSMGLAPDKFNLSDLSGMSRLLGLIAANFITSGILSVAFYLRQAPLPEESTGNTETLTKPETPKTGE